MFITDLSQCISDVNTLNNFIVQICKTINLPRLVAFVCRLLLSLLNQLSKQSCGRPHNNSSCTWEVFAHTALILQME